MAVFVKIAIYGWLPVVLAIFAALPPRRALIVSVLTGWLFLPVTSFHFVGNPSLDKMLLVLGSALVGAVVFDARRWANLSYFPAWVDLPMLAWCLCPLATALTNDPELTTKDGVSWCIQQFVAWGLPYLFGRVYFSSREALRELLVAVFVGGLAYVPLCLFEVRFSPQLHRLVYGFHQHEFGQAIRFGGYRPMVFLQHGLAVGIFMTAASLAGVVLWRTGALRRVAGVPTGVLLPVLLATTVLCKSTGALIYLAAGLACLCLCRLTGRGGAVLLLLVLPAAYVTTRTALNWNGEGLEPVVAAKVNEGRAQSFAFRLENEKEIAARAMLRPWYGWGGYARAFVLNEWGNCKYTPDSLWIIAFGTYGAVGLASLLLLAAPAACLVWRLPHDAWCDARFAGVVAFALLFAIHMLDNMLNSMNDPVVVVGLGGLCGMLVAGRRPAAAVAPRPHGPGATPGGRGETGGRHEVPFGRQPC